MQQSKRKKDSLPGALKEGKSFTWTVPDGGNLDSMRKAIQHGQTLTMSPIGDPKENFQPTQRPSGYLSLFRIPSGPQRVTSYPQSNLLALSEKLTERQLRLTGGEHLMVTQKFRTSELQHVNLLTIQEVANWAKVSTKTIYRWISDNRIPAIRLGNRTYRIPEQAIIDYLKQNGFDHLLP